MPSKKVNSKKQKPFFRSKKGIALLVIFFLLIAATTFFLLRIEDMAEKRLLDVINTELAPNAEIEFGDFSFSTFPAGLEIRDIKLVHITPFEEHTPEKSADAVKAFEISRLEFSGINLFRMLVTREWGLEDIIIEGLDFKLVPISDGRLADATPFRQPPPFRIGKITVDDANFFIFRERESEEPSYEIHHIYSEIDNFSVTDIEEPFHTYFDHLLFQSSLFQYHTSNGHYSIGVDSVSVSSLEEYVWTGRGFVKPHLSANEMAGDIGYETDRFDVSFDEFTAQNFEVNRWLAENELVAQSLGIEKPSIDIHRDKSYPREERDERSLPIDYLKKLPFTVQIDSVWWKNGSLSYTEDFVNEGRKGNIYFNDTDLTITKVQNRSMDETIEARVRARFMGIADISLEGSFSMNETSDHTIAGSMSGFDLQELNASLEEWVFVRVRSGRLEQADFYFGANEERADGELRFIYSDLEIRFLDEGSLEETRRRRLRSFIANRFRIHSQNRIEDPRTGTIDFERDKERSAFNYWWKSIASGMLDSVKR
jgi:hypothetical protein